MQTTNIKSIEGLNFASFQVHENAKEKGFYDEEKNTGEMIALMHSELSEALEADREGKYCDVDVNILMIQDEDFFFVESYKQSVKGTFEEEMADIVIRVMDMCAFKGIDLESHIAAKMRFNKCRSYNHGGKKY